VTSVERKAARFQRRKAAREARKNDRLMRYDDFNRITDTDNLYASFNRSKRGVSWKESVQRYEANAIRNIAATRKYLKYCLSEIEKVCRSLKITVNEKKTRIVKLSRGMEFLKGKYKLLPSGKVLRFPGKDSAKRMRRKLKKFKALIDAGKMDFADLRTAYQSWRGNYMRRFNARYRIGYMDKLYNELFINIHNSQEVLQNGLFVEKERRGLPPHRPRGGGQP
jgi:hypothetical protein